MNRTTRVSLWLFGAFVFAPAIRAQTPFAAGFESPGVSDEISALAVFDPDGSGPLQSVLVAGGAFAATANGPASNLASWNGSSWSPIGVGADDWVGALETFDPDGSGPAPTALYLAGAFTHIGGGTVNHIASWNGTAFQPLALGLDDWADALVAFDDDGAGPHPTALYVGGTFEHAGSTAVNYIAKWNGTSFEALGAGLDGPVATMAVYNGALYVGGFFNAAGASTANYIAKWNGTAWQTVGAGFDGPVQALAVFDPDGSGPAASVLVAGGAFQSSGSTAVSGIAAWNGTTWSALASGITAPGATPSIRALRVVDNGAGPRLYATGLFRTAGANSAPIGYVPDTPGCGGLMVVASWDGSTWSTLGSGMTCHANDVGRAILSFDDDHDGTPSLFVAGHFSTAAAASTAGIARWSGTSWTPLGVGQGLSGTVRALAAIPGATNSFVAAGHFSTAGSILANRVAKWDGTSWHPIGLGTAGAVLDGDVNALVYQGSTLILGGSFTTANGTLVNHVARWTGSGDLQPLGVGTQGEVLALASFQGRTIVGGSFRSAGGGTTNAIAAWDDATGTWSALSTGMDGVVRALKTFDDGTGNALYVAGDFSTAGGVPASGIARWDGTNWSALGDGLCCESVSALTTFDDGSGLALYAGGNFESSGTNSIRGVARWNPSSATWSALGVGLAIGRTSGALTLYGGTFAGSPTLFVGGEFALAGGVSAQNLARWNGSAWSAIGAGANGVVRALLPYQPPTGSAGVLVAGDFTVIDGRATSRIAFAQ